MQLSYRQFSLPCRHPFTIARGTTTVQETLIVSLEQDGRVGYGEALRSSYYGATLEKSRRRLDRLAPWIESYRLEEPADFWQVAHQRLCGSLAEDDGHGASFVLAALDCAAHDLWGKLRGEPVWKLWGLDVQKAVVSDYTIGIDTLERMIAKLQEMPGWPVYKIKLGTDRDVEIVRRLRGHTDAVFRVDANCAWTAGQTIENSHALKELGVELIEQPLPPGEVESQRAAFQASVLPLMADESCLEPPDVEACRGCFHGVNIKLPKCGGLTPAREMIDRARRLGMKVMVGCFTESTVGISAAAQLLPLLDYADLDGAVLITNDPAQGVTIDRGRAIFPEENGCGVRMLER